MENTKEKSYFNELGFKPTIEKLVDHDCETISGR